MKGILRTLMREPLVQFVVAGAGLFLLFQARASQDGEPDRIVVDATRIEQMASGFARTWQRTPTEAELKGLIDDHVREEIAAREARRLGLDQDDTLIRRRLRQKLEFLVEDDVQEAAPSDDELRAWLDANPDGFRLDPEVSFKQVLVSPYSLGGMTDADIERLRARLAAMGPEAVASELGEPLRLLPDALERASRREVAALFGEPFADRVLGLPLNRWGGPAESAYGIHLVLVTHRAPGRVPPLAEVREGVARDLLAARRAQRLDAMYRHLLERHPVVVAQPPRVSAGRTVVP
jgi:PPIC-type PPIASE domain